ncbi:hypothetical protein [Vibrio sp. Hal054]|uniref:hypothetical protein n=1 Tax=Vibrio sp. Hal054 TaxID=3035158 RepID=UPI00301CE50A
MFSGAVRFKYHNSSNTIASDGRVLSGRAITHNCVAALLKDGSRHLAPFGGFLSYPQLRKLQLVKLVDIFQFTLEDLPELAKWQDIPIGSLCLGAYLNEHYYLMLDQNFSPLLIEPPAKDESKSNVNNVFELKPLK